MKKKILIIAAVIVFLALSAVCIFKLPELQKFTKGGERIKGNIENIKIECTGGSVTIAATSRVYFSLEEKPAAKSKADSTIEWLVAGNTLKIRCGSEEECEYTVGVPAETVLDDLDIKGDGIKAQVSGLTVRDLTLRTGSGSLNVSESKCIDALIVESDSAPVQIDKTFARRMDIESESGSVLVKEPSFQRDCIVETDSGDINIEVLEGSRLNIKESHGKGSFSSTFKSDEQGDKIILKTRSGKIDITGSGTSVIPEESVTSVPETTPQSETGSTTEKAKETTVKKS